MFVTDSHELRQAARTMVSGLIATWAMALVIGDLCAYLTLNPTLSLPRGLYLLRPGRSLERGDLVDLPIPLEVRPLLAARRYLPLSFHLLKRLVAVPGDRVCVDADSFTVNGRVISHVARTDSSGRALPPARPYCDVVTGRRGFVATPASTSLDSRFFGPVELADLTLAVPIWTQSSP